MSEQLAMRPGNGWKHLAGPVWEHASGARVHTHGLVKTPDGKCYSLNNWSDSKEGRLLVRINGGNKRRGLMAWAVNLVGPSH